MHGNRLITLVKFISGNINMADNIISVEQEISNVEMSRPHVVVLGAGASRAACPNGDANSKILPLMNDFTEILGLTKLISDWGINPKRNFEEIYSELAEQHKKNEIEEIEAKVKNYFKQLKLPHQPTIYDHLLLSLREIDLIATFNWDPLLVQAYDRNSRKGVKLPQLLFLHGCVDIGYCKEHKIKGSIGRPCKEMCSEIYSPSPLLYPIRKKDYVSNQFISHEWNIFKSYLKRAFMLTVFGYSGPKTDQEAIAAMKEAWGNMDHRHLEQVTFISIQSEQEISENWEEFIFADHWELKDSFYDSWIAKHPRRTGEAYLNQFIKAKYIIDNSIPCHLDFPELWDWFRQFEEAETNFLKNKIVKVAS